MALIKIVDAPIKDFYGETITVPASSAAQMPLAVRVGFSEILVEFAAASRLHLAPQIGAVYFYDVSSAAGYRWHNLLDKDKALVNRHVAGDTGKVLNSMTASDFLYIGVVDTVGGYRVDMDASLNNSTPATLTSEYLRTDKTFVTVSITDGTITNTRTLAQDGNITLTTPADWGRGNLRTILGDDNAPNDELFWQRFIVSATLDSSVEIEEIIPINRNSDSGTNTAGAMYAKAAVEYTVDLAPDVGAIQFIAQADTNTTLNLTWIKR